MLRKGSGDGIGFAGETAESNNITKSGGLRRAASGPPPSLLLGGPWPTTVYISLFVSLHPCIT